MRRDDILLLFLTSHGSREGAVVSWDGGDDVLSPEWLGAILSLSKIRRRVIVVSACYSGVFADVLADPETIVITAADGLHTSFGCGDDDDWTYFGEALFHQAMPVSATLRQAFHLAELSVYWREALHFYAHSNPQMRGGEAIAPFLLIHRGAPDDGAHFPAPEASAVERERLLDANRRASHLPSRGKRIARIAAPRASAWACGPQRSVVRLRC